MKKYKMTETDSCPRCGLIETTKHLLLECVHAKNMTKIGKSCEFVNNFEEVVKSCNSQGITIVKMKIIQQLIQIERPMKWDQDKLHTIMCRQQTSGLSTAVVRLPLGILSVWPVDGRRRAR
jgi:hypothetical protein